MTISVVECPHCHYRFNYEFIPGASFTSIRLGTLRIFTCPNCKELHKFDITHFGQDSSLPTHGDNAQTSVGARRIAVMLGPLLILAAAGALLLFAGLFQSILVSIIPLTVGIVWIVVYVAYLYGQAGRNTNGKKREAK